jgi:hypothetical protein
LKKQLNRKKAQKAQNINHLQRQSNILLFAVFAPYCGRPIAVFIAWS